MSGTAAHVLSTLGTAAFAPALDALLADHADASTARLAIAGCARLGPAFDPASDEAPARLVIRRYPRP